ncbi:MAG: YggS family pyridoxal phosphate-dependent enzyme [Eubacterium sp.]|nr:YggS family pyridoxal phosphate-dependent enzyme [Eubacterium sp.]
MGELTTNLERVEARVAAACARAGRERSDVTLIAVSKTKPVPMLEEIYSDGVRDFGENKVQEICAKQPVLPDDIRWHMIGHLQTNKVRQVIDKACMIHSVDSLKLAQVIEKEAAKKDLVVPVLFEVNVAEEESKFGARTEETAAIIQEIALLPHVRVRGLMTIAPFVDDPEENRPVFRRLKELSVDIAEKNINNVSMCELSMGMTGDFEVAIEEGATFVRIGTAIFGARNYDK